MILLKNGTLIDWQTLEFRQTDVRVGTGSLTPQPGLDKIIDCTGKFITKTFANGHHHAYSALSRGMPAPKKNPENFREILQYIWWNLDKSLDAEMIRSSALVTAMACARSGVTFAIDHHASPFDIGGSLEIIAGAFNEVGIGHLLCYEVSDRDGMEIAEKGLAETAGYLAKRQGLVGLHASFTVGDRTMEQAVQLAEQTGSGIHIHVAEDRYDQEHCLSTHHRRIVERLSEKGVLQFPKTILAHCIHIDGHEREMVEQSPVWVVQNMESNLNNAVGKFNPAGLGGNIMLGTDGMHSDMLQSARSAFFSGRDTDPVGYPGIYHRLRNIHHYLQSNGFHGDGDDNLVVFDYDPPTPFNRDNFFGHLLFGSPSWKVRHVIAGGNLIVEDGRIVTVDEEKILRDARIQAQRLWDRMKR